MDIKTLTRMGRGQLLEFMPRPNAKSLAETIAAFANADGGTILVGLGTAGTVLEEIEPEHVEALLLRAQTMCRPPVRTEWRHLRTRHGIAVAVSVPHSPELHSLVDGRVLLRSGRRNRPLSGGEVRHLASAKGTGDYEKGVVPGATAADLDDGIIAEYAEKRRLRGPQGEKLSDTELLLDSGAVNAEARCRRSLAFCTQPTTPVTSEWCLAGALCRHRASWP